MHAFVINEKLNRGKNFERFSLSVSGEITIVESFSLLFNNILLSLNENLNEIDSYTCKETNQKEG